MTLWEIDIYPGPDQPDLSAGSIISDAEDLGLREPLSVATAHGYLIEGNLTAAQADQLAQQLLADGVVERTVVGQVGDDKLSTPPNGRPCLIHVMPKPGVMDPVAQSALRAIQDFSIPAQAVRTFRKYWLSELAETEVELLCEKILANDSIEQVVVGTLQLDQLQVGSPYEFELKIVKLSELDDEGLERLSREGQLYLTLVEMQTIQQHFRDLEREPVDVELETIAQTWSEHCSHKTLAGRIAYQDERGERQFENMLKETIFAATQQIRKDLGDQDWCVSVFEDNAGIVRFDEENNVVFKVETPRNPKGVTSFGTQS